jgi:hypothetical protein
VGWVAGSRGDYDGAQAAVEHAYSLAVRLGDQYLELTTLSYLGTLALRRGALDLARQQFEDSRALAERLGDRHRLAHAWSRLGMLSLHRGDVASAGPLMTRALAYWREIDHPGGLLTGLEDLAQLAAAAGQERRALRLMGAAAARRDDLGWSNREPLYALGLASLLGAGIADPAWVEGHAMSLDEAVALALEDDLRSDAL